MEHINTAAMTSINLAAIVGFSFTINVKIKSGFIDH